MAFTSFQLHPDLLKGIKDLAYHAPTPIQSQAIPPALEGRDLLACAATGSGKTVAFMLPTLNRLLSHKVDRRAVRALVLTPTRELATQILENVQALATHTPLSAAAIIGGVSMGPQAHAFRTGTEILVATPGRLLDHLKAPYAKLDTVEVLILDEADRMLDMGFIPDVRRILRALPQKRQTLFFSATMPNEIRQLTMEMLKNPITLQIDRQSTPAAGITQAIYPVPQHLKTALLKKLLENPELDSVIVFTRTKHRANRLAAQLSASNLASVPIHGNRTQGQRTAALEGFKSGKFRVLVATDIAARGIDIQDVSHVINYDCPHLAEDYIHRVGRTGRAAATGDAFTFVSPDEHSNLRTIERAIGKRLPQVTLPDFDYTQQAAEKLEVPIQQRIAAIRAQKAKERSNRDAKIQKKYGNTPPPYARPQQAPSHGAPHARPQQGHSNAPRPAHPQGQPKPAPKQGASHQPHQSQGGDGQKHFPKGGGNNRNPFFNKNNRRQGPASRRER